MTGGRSVCEVILYVKDMARAVAFWRDAMGLGVREPAGAGDLRDAKWVELDTGACAICLHAGGGGNVGADAAKVVLLVEDIRAARADLATRGVKLGAVRRPAPGVLVCDGRDPDGHPFSLESRAAPA
jgi:predicted enzyme related to lactoylglutathione lyase